MKLFLLRPLNKNAGPWKPWYDKAFGYVIRAETEQEARQTAQNEGCDETRGFSAWTDPLLSSCVELSAIGDAGIVMQDFHAA